MEVKFDSLTPFEKIKNSTDYVFEIVNKNGKVVLLKGDQPVYIITKYNSGEDAIKQSTGNKVSKYTLQEAMKIILSETTDKTMHAAALADKIYTRGLYKQKNGEKAQYNQIRARCGQTLKYLRHSLG